MTTTQTDGHRRWTHTAIITAAIAYGPRQMSQTAPAGTTVELLQDPARQAGAFITVRLGYYTGVARLADLTNVQAAR